VIRRVSKGSTLVALLVLSTKAIAATTGAVPDFSEGAVISPEGRANPYQLSPEDFAQVREKGRGHAISYPVEATGILPPYAPFEEGVNEFLGSSGVDHVLSWVGLHPFPNESEQGVYSVPYPEGVRPDYRMGLTFITTPKGRGFTFACAECHSSHLFGKTVLGMTNRFPHANETFECAKNALQFGSPVFADYLLSMLTNATPGETEMIDTVRDRVRAIGVRSPQVLGLDTSLAQVALSLARRSQDAYASFSTEFEEHPREEVLETVAADSKPAVWWDVKYKNRWLSDGSVVSGNPIYTNLLWNEIGRAGDLKQIEGWLEKNSDVIEELTTAVFSSEAPKVTDFFEKARLQKKFDLQRLKKGQKTFVQYCARCHGTYDKGWDLPTSANSAPLSFADRLSTVQVHYHDQTPVVDVGTDPSRYEGMASLERGLNPLLISQQNSIVIKTQKGYVPPPLVGIWARWPYFHNNSVPSLCSVLTRHEKRPTAYYAAEANDPDRDFDLNCNGYPSERKLSPAWLGQEYFYDTTRPAMGNSGHDEGIFLRDGKELLSSGEKQDLILFLQTL
jgi:hypothetical protein